MPITVQLQTPYTTSGECGVCVYLRQCFPIQNRPILTAGLLSSTFASNLYIIHEIGASKIHPENTTRTQCTGSALEKGARNPGAVVEEREGSTPLQIFHYGPTQRHCPQRLWSSNVGSASTDYHPP